MDDNLLAATCIADEAAGEPYEGKVAVGCVILNRMAAQYESDGTVTGTVEKRFQFSGFWFAMEAGHYTQVEFDQAGAAAEAQTLYNEFSTQPIWSDCVKAWWDARQWANGQPLSFTPGPQFEQLDHNAVLYFNPRVCAAPDWATPDRLEAVIFRHNFYNAGQST